MIHTSVLLQEAIEGLTLGDGDVVIDATLGSGGHTQAMLGVGKDISVIGFDLDIEAIERSRARLGDDKRVTLVCASYKTMTSVVEGLGVTGVNKVLFDFGFSSDQIETSGRGFSFLRDEPLLMTFTEAPGPNDLTAREIVNTWDEDTIRGVLRGYGEERHAGRIAKAILKARESKSIETTFELVEIIRSSVPRDYLTKKIHPATKTFQALRIAVNDELATVADGLDSAFRLIPKGGKIAAISFHSHEDRIVKQMFKAWSQTKFATIVTKKPIVAGDAELKINPRARSAKLRILEKN